MDTPLLDQEKSQSLELDSDTILQLQQDEEPIPHFLRSYSVPYQTETSNRRLISQHVLVQIIELGLNVDLATQILDSLEPEYFLDYPFYTILDQVVDQLFLLKDYQETKDNTLKQNLYQQLQNVIRQQENHLNEELRQSHSIGNNEQICGICLSPLEKDYKQLLCQHKFCKECFTENFRQKIFNGLSDRMTCPQDDCEELISDQMIEDLLGKNIKNTMNKFRRIKQLSKDTNLIQCPKIGCEEFVQKAKGQKKLICQCGELICPECHRQYHPGSNCNQQMDKEFKIAVQTLYLQQCPKCKSHIQKNDGCNHMTCRQCSYEFCWLCRAKHSERHYQAWNLLGCPDLLFSERTPFKYPNCYRFWIILGLIIFGLPIAIISLALGIIVLTLFLPIILYFIKYGKDFNQEGSCYKFGFVLFFGILSILVSPISAGLLLLISAFGIILGIPYLIYCLCQMCLG